MIYRYTPYFIFKRLWGDRRKYGLVADENDKDYIAWLDNYINFYQGTQKGFIGRLVTNFGFSVMNKVNLMDKKVLEIGPGIIAHFKFHRGTPSEYHLLDIKQEFLDLSGSLLSEKYPNIVTHLYEGKNIPLDDDQYDVVLSFNQLEHCTDLEAFLDEVYRVLKPGGTFAGAVPTEGSLAWGTGRFITSRRFVKKNFSFDLDKIICWEHPNFINKIISLLNKRFSKMTYSKKPFSFFPLDLNLAVNFIAHKETIDE